jgi:membrane-associated phospholipid phosphatase
VTVGRPLKTRPLKTRPLGTLVPFRTPDRRLGLRLGIALLAAFLIGVPFLALLFLVRAKWSPLVQVDMAISADLHAAALRQPALVRASQVVSTVFDPYVFRVVATVVAVWLLASHRPRLAAWTLVTIWGAALLGLVLKIAVGRARPVFDVAVETAPGRSFPSGHALGSLVGCGVLLLVLVPLARSARARRLCWTAAALIVLAVGMARVVLGVHYPSDVVAAWVLGLGWLAATTAAFQAWRREAGARPVEPAVEGLEPEMGEPDLGEPDGGEAGGVRAHDLGRSGS